MNNNIENVVTGNNIYISGISGTDIEYSPLPIIDGNTQITEISVPFHLSYNLLVDIKHGLDSMIVARNSWVC